MNRVDLKTAAIMNSWRSLLKASLSLFDSKKLTFALSSQFLWDLDAAATMSAVLSYQW